ncbi:MAG: ABC transporter ATP-binding protein [Anaerolineaceae bacterium]
MENKTILEVQKVSRDLSNGEKVFPILHNVNFSVNQGEWVALLGPSGSGKTTLLGIMAGIDRPTRGKVVLDGQEISALKEGKLARLRNEKIGIVFQSFFLINSMTALENVAVPLFIRSDRKQCLKQASEMLSRVGLSHRLGHLPHQLSGGEQQRVAIARALVTQPMILYADEPTGNLDSTTGQQVLDLMKELRRTMHLTLLMVTHDQHIANMADRQLHLYDGRLTENKPTTNQPVPLAASPLGV